MTPRLRFARSAREAFQGRGNPSLAPRISTFAGGFHTPWRERLWRFLRKVLYG